MGAVLTLPALPSKTRLKYEGPLRVAAATVARAALGTVTSATVVGELSRPTDEDTVEQLVRDVADEFDLEAEIHFDPEHASFSVRFIL